MSVIPFPENRLRADCPPPHMVAIAPHEGEWAVWSVTKAGDYLVWSGPYQDALTRAADFGARRGLNEATIWQRPWPPIWPSSSPSGEDAA